MVVTREEAAARALAAVGNPNIPDTCQLWTRGIFDAPSAGDQDHDSDADAVDGWLAEPPDARHPGDRNPPDGVPVSWRGGTNGHGHRAVTAGGRVVSTDAPTRGQIGIVDLGWFETNWGLTYLGWSDSITGITIPQEDDMADPDVRAQLDRIEAAATDARNKVYGLAGAEADRAKAARKRDAALLELAEDAATADDLAAVKAKVRKIKQLLTEETPA